MEYSEPELVIPALEILNLFDEGLATTELMTLLRQDLEPTGRDLDILDGRSDDRFSQKVRNLKSHDTLERKGLAVFNDGRFQITLAGREYIRDHKTVFETVSKQGFAKSDRKRLAEDDYDSLLVEEGAAMRLPKKVYERSRKLTEFAREAFADSQGRIICTGCGFEGSAHYGVGGLGLIELHHLRPLHLRQGRSEKMQLHEALEGLAPLCPNCHRMVHRDAEILMPLSDLQTLTGYGSPPS
jgi:predicted HNH restriction endonuclease